MGDTPSVRTLVVENDQALSEILCDELRSRGHQAVGAPTALAARDQLKEAEFDVALIDLALPDGSGPDLLRQIADEDLQTETIVLTASASASAAIEAMRLGAYDYVTRPARMDEIEVLVLKAAEKARLRRENRALKARVQRHETVEGLLTEDPALKEILDSLGRIAQTDLPVLIQGEAGTGQELVARVVHRLSPRAPFAFAAMNCGAIPEAALEDELFGHEKASVAGAMVRKPGLFEVADRGVVFLNQVDELPPSVQAKLLRALESREFFRVGSSRPVRADVRVVSAPKGLKGDAPGGGLREDLYYRLNGVTVRLSPLRERQRDIPLLAEHFARRLAPPRKLSARALTSLQGYRWPGNLRELQMVIERAAILSSQHTLEPEDLPLDIRDPNWQVRPARDGCTLADMELEYIEAVLRQNQGHRGRTAKALGIDPKTLYNKLGPRRPRRKDRPI